MSPLLWALWWLYRVALVQLVYQPKIYMFLILHSKDHAGIGWWFKALVLGHVMVMLWLLWDKDTLCVLVAMMESGLWLMFGPWTLPQSLMNGGSWNLKVKGPLHACMQLPAHVLMVSSYFVEGEMQTVCHWLVRMDLRSIEMVVGNGQLLPVFHHLQDINMLQFLLMHGFMYLGEHLVEGAWWKIHLASQYWIQQLEFGVIQSLLLLVRGPVDIVLMLLVEMLRLN
uniref:Uncharacterized protein n=2 Tax=Opuntia streptacantha TaxID=393608 RepID=A0A7C9EIG7_OPUST